MSDAKEYIDTYLQIGMDTPDTLFAKEVGDEVIMYGISKSIIPTGPGKGVLFIETDPKYACDKDKKKTIHIEIDETNSLSSIINDGVMNFLFNKPTFVRGHIKSILTVIKADGTRTDEILIKPSHDLRVVL